MQLHTESDVRGDTQVRPERTVLAGLPSLLSILSTYPDPATVLESLVHGPLHRYQVRGAGLWQVREDTAQMIAVFGHSSEESEQWASIPLESQAPVANCIRDGQIYTYSPDSFMSSFPGLSHVPATKDEVHWFVFGDAIRDLDIGVNAVVVPIAARGMALGAYGFMTTGRFAWPANELSALSAYASSLALWMSNAKRHSPATMPRPRLTERQLEILRLVLHGRSNSFIAARLGISMSTTKQELQRACVALDARDRIAAAENARARGLIGG